MMESYVFVYPMATSTLGHRSKIPYLKLVDGTAIESQLGSWNIL